MSCGVGSAVRELWVRWDGMGGKTGGVVCGPEKGGSSFHGWGVWVGMLWFFAGGVVDVIWGRGLGGLGDTDVCVPPVGCVLVRNFESCSRVGWLGGMWGCLVHSMCAEHIR